MAKTITDEQMKLSIVINGDSAQKELFDLEKSTRALTDSNKALLVQKQLLEKQGKKDTAEYKNLTATIKANTAEINANKNKMSELQKEIGLTGMTMAQLQSKATMLRNTLRNLVPGSDDYKKYQAELTQVNNRLGELRGNSTTARMSIGSLADSFNRYQGIALSAVAAMTGVVLSIQKIIDINAKLSDAQSDVMKTTGMTKLEVDELTKSFGMLQTRTSRIDLLGIAEVGGRLGIAKGEIQDFVKVMNMAAVSLGDSFEGGAGEVAEKLGKIKGLYGELNDASVELAFNAVGSALNDLGAAGAASEANMTDFVTRVGSMPEAIKPSIATALGLAAAFEESGLKAEVAASNYSKVISIAANNVEGFASVMGKPKKAMEDLMRTNPNEFFLQFANSLKKYEDDPIALAKIFDNLKLNDNEVKSVLGAASKNVEFFREKIELANVSLADGTSLLKEYDIKNNNLAATYEKISKKISGWFSSEGFNNFLINVFNGFAKLIGAVHDTDGSMSKWKNTILFTAKAILIVTSALVTNVAWQKLVALWTNRNTEANLLYSIGAKARAFADGVAMVASQAYAAVTMLLTGNIVGATQAFRVMTATMMTTPWGFILGAVAAVGAAYLIFKENAIEASNAQTILNDATIEAEGAVRKEVEELDRLVKIAKDDNASKEARAAAIKKINELMPDSIGFITQENIKTFEGKKILDQYIESLLKKQKLKALEKRADSLNDKITEKEGEKITDGVGWMDQGWAYVTNLGNQTGVTNDLLKISLERRKKTIDEYQKELNATNEQIKNVMMQSPELINSSSNTEADTSTSTFKTPNGSGDKTTKGAGATKNPNSSAEEINRLKLEDEAKFNDAYLKLVRQREDEKIAAMADGYEKDMLLENQRYQREIDDLNKQKVHKYELAKLDEDIAKAKESKDTKKYNALLKIKEDWAERNKAIDDQVNAIIEGKMAIHNTKLAIIEEKAAKELLDKQQENFDRAKQNRETAFLDELNQGNYSEAEKKKKTDEFNKNELGIQKEYLKSKIKELNDIIAGNVVDNIDFSLLSPEAKEKLKKDVETVQNALVKIQSGDPNKAGKEIDLGLSGANKDILGFSQKQWDDFLTNIEKGTIGIQTMQMATQLASQVFGQLDQYMTASENATVKKTETAANKKKKALDKQLKDGIISKQTYDKKVAKLDKEVDDKKFEIELKQAKRKKAMSIIDTVVNTSVAIMQAYSQLGPIGGTVAAVLIGVMGALQIATIASQPLPTKGYEEGLYPEYVKRQQDGKVFKSKYQGKTRSGLVSETSHFLVAENGPEMVIDNKAWTQLDPKLKDDLVRNLQGIKGFENGLYNPTTQRYEVPAASSTSNNNDALIQAMFVAITENTSVMKDLRDNGLVAMVSNRDLKSMKNLKDGINDYEELRNKSKK